MILEENIRLIFGLKVRMHRQEQKLSLSELAKKAEMSVSYINEIEKGKKYPKRNKITSLAAALKVSYDELVSLKISKKLGAISKLLNSNILQELPLDVFGLEPRNLLELMSDAPSKLSAFINTIVEISRNYNLTVENFYFSVLRSYQEIHDNYFEEVEIAAKEFRRKIIDDDKPLEIQLRQYLTTFCNYRIDEESLSEHEALDTLRTVIKVEDDGTNVLMINKKLNARRRTFIYAREAAFQVLNLQERSMTYSWMQVKSFDMLFNDYMATYFAGAFLVPEEALVEDLQEIVHSNSFSNEKMLDLIAKHNTSPETFLHRLTSILPKHFGLSKIFFLRLDHIPGSNRYSLTKELHLDGLHSPHGTVLSEHYCRRWVSLKIFEDLEQARSEGKEDEYICDAQTSRYITSGKEYFCISVARALPLVDETIDTSITIGFLINDNFREKSKLWQSEKVRMEFVNETCERCPSVDCQVRASDSIVLKKEQQEKERIAALEAILGKPVVS
ncbi:helix-turn-helix domain-containing protein [Flammeovirga sp. SJP92]|uniref:helix-turn-helix domain-containing protein n=1 Tax=Flammeovirga sp. SJP92 TaxID=1775430 RepID=UPI002110033B|nr:helix-turn-helix transcriptional regulator [Flammeovirga sp. SJP92]